MARYAHDYEARAVERQRWRQARHPGHGAGYGGRRREAELRGGYTAEYGRPGEFDEWEIPVYDEELRRGARRARLPHKPAHGYPVRGIHTYDLDYGSTGGPTTDYSGRTGYPVLQPRPSRDEELPPRGPYTPTLEERYRERTLYGGVPPGYRGRGGSRSRRAR
jgi:hypothetical protein